MSELRFTTSWDDGHPLDLRVAELLAKHGFAGTFYAPRRNVEGRAVMTTGELRTLAAGFEIGAHTIDHVRLDRLAAAEVERQVVEGKRRIEDELGTAVIGFCYPGGVHDKGVRARVAAAGFRYARTIDNFRIEPATDAFQTPTTIQLYRHRRVTYVTNFLRGGDWRKRAGGFGAALAAPSLELRLEQLLHRAAEVRGVFHLWGHSWELQEHGLWDVLDWLLALAAQLVPRERRVTNAALLPG
jgi:peptidoglycan/xylan/chitin deacetylase (PgdA/CDA1 family)